MSTPAPGPDGHRPEGRQPDPYDTAPYKPYDAKPYAGDAFGSGDPDAQPYPTATAGQGGYPQAPYPQNFPAAGPYGQQGHAPGPYGRQAYAPGPYGRPYAAQKSRVVAGILGILLGALGIHRFYLGFTAIGIIQILMSTVLIFFTFGLSAIAATIWGLVEGILILVGSQQFQRDAHGVPLKD